MRFLLISFNHEISPYPVMPLGVYYISDYLKKNSVEVDIIDLYLEIDYMQAVKKHLKNHDYMAIGISIRNIDNILYPDTLSYIDEIRFMVKSIKELTQIPVILGGSGFSIFPEEMLCYCRADYGIKGEGENALLKLLNNIDNKEYLSKIANLHIRSESEIKTGQSMVNPDFINSYPVREKCLTAPYIKTGGMINIQIKRGCPFDCIYCTYPHIDGRSLRIRDHQSIIEEIKYLKNSYNFDYFYFVDSIFNYPLEDTKKLLRAIEEKDLRIKWTAFFNPKFVDRELLELCIRTGCDEIEFGTESGSDFILNYLKKGFTKKDIKRAKSICDDLGIRTMFYLLIGSPAESRETIDESIDFLKSLSPDAIVVMLGIRIYPNTPLYEQCLTDGIISQDHDLLKPYFHISDKIMEYAIKRFAKLSDNDARWVIPSLKINYYPEKLIKLRKFGSKGPLWSRLKKIKPHK